ncbi:hypothetical protein [Kaistella jeonii]|uniref:Uncharacterized protein n=1 Tax=Kaistella jeonii TaxID=266749 RepID=A0A0C1F9D6_9FLAO|nr:hypothetical protein [Kaistella jeonii]KIA88513.1 hypothetical protein OA86_10810 [Kaistella jeonii]SFC19607.1 hypothetical protein SAMN05421876_10913 [Kaistella jeonii]VEI97024.1 Uncharacterised protein [Kaistella jeonii]
MKKIISRLQEPTPRFFRRIRNFGLLLTGISAVISTAVIPLPAVLITIAGYTALAGGIASAVSQTAVIKEEKP